MVTVAKAEVSHGTKLETAKRQNGEGLPLHGMATLPADLATLTLNRFHLKSSPISTFMMTVRPTPVQRRAFELLDLDPDRDVAMYLAG